MTVPPAWILKPTDRDVLSGEMVEIPCTVSGKPDPKIMWSLSSNTFNIYIKYIRNKINLRN